MKGIKGLIVAIGLGIAGAFLNWAYLASRSTEEEMVTFIGIKNGQTINRGELLRDDFLVPVAIPRKAIGNLKDFAFLYDTKHTVVDRRVWRAIAGDSLLLREDMAPPPQSLKLEEGEQIMWIPVESRAFVPSLVSPGDEVKFLVPKLTPAVAGNPGVAVAESGEAVSSRTLEIGPFRVRTLGNRLSSADDWSTAKMPQLQENVIGISVLTQDEKKKAVELWDVLQATNYHQVGMEKLGPKSKPPEQAQ